MIKPLYTKSKEIKKLNKEIRTYQEWWRDRPCEAQQLGY